MSVWTRLQFSRNQGVAWGRWAVVASILAFGDLASAQTINGSLVPTRTSGVAPLYVFFDASATTCTGSTQCDAINGGAFRNLMFQWNFGDDPAARWAFGTKTLKNTAAGPVTAHVFEKAGTYNVQLVIRGPAGGSRTLATQITVEDPNAHWAGAKTTCISSSGIFTGCPSGSATMTTGNLNATEAACDVADHRCLFRGGETFTATGTFMMDAQGPGLIGSFGTGRATLVLAPDGKQPMFANRGANDWRLTNLSFKGPGNVVVGGGGAAVFDAFRSFQNVLIHNTTVVPGTLHQVVSIAGQSLDLAKQDIPSGVGVVGNDWQDLGFGNGGNILFVAVARAAFLGNRFFDTLGGEHNFRMQHGERIVMTSNTLGEPKGGKGMIQIRSRDQCPGGQCDPGAGGGTTCSAGCGRPTKFVVVSDNVLIGNKLSTHIGMVGSETVTTTCQGEDVIVERNFITSTPGANELQNAIQIGNVRRAAVRNNVLFGEGWIDYRFIVTVKQAQGGGVNEALAAYNNTCYVQPPNAIPIRCVSGAYRTFNNLLYAPQSPFEKIVVESSASEDGNGIEGNTVVTTNPFIVASPTQPQDFALASGVSPINLGKLTFFVGNDFTGGTRDATPDVGAFEFGAGGAPVVTDTPPAPPVLLEVTVIP
jgi:PKD repeat protein